MWIVVGFTYLSIGLSLITAAATTVVIVPRHFFLFFRWLGAFESSTEMRARMTLGAVEVQDREWRDVRW